MGLLIGFFGLPDTGKTTTAALVFARIKEIGLPCEFLTEQARLLIAEARYNNTPIDSALQEQVFVSQMRYEKVLKQTSMITITDSCLYNSLFYLPDQALEASKDVIPSNHYDIIFWCDQTEKSSSIKDENRIHTPTDIQQLSSKTKDILENIPFKTSKLTGTIKNRSQDAFRVVMDLITRNTSIKTQ